MVPEQDRELDRGDSASKDDLDCKIVLVTQLATGYTLDELLHLGETLNFSNAEADDVVSITIMKANESLSIQAACKQLFKLNQDLRGNTLAIRRAHQSNYNQSIVDTKTRIGDPSSDEAEGDCHECQHHHEDDRKCNFMLSTISQTRECCEAKHFRCAQGSCRTPNQYLRTATFEDIM